MAALEEQLSHPVLPPGEHELAELRDNDPSLYLGKGVTQAVGQVMQTILPALKGKNISAQQEIDQILTELADDQGRKLGSNAMLGVSLACAKAAAISYRLPLYRYLGGSNANILPVPMMNILNGGAHASNNLDIQELMIIPTRQKLFPGTGTVLPCLPSFKGDSQRKGSLHRGGR